MVPRDLDVRETTGGWKFYPDGDALYVVDGQHRVESVRKLYDDMDGGHEKWGDFELPFVYMLGASEREEMEQFYVVNSNAKSVPTALAFDLLKQMAESSPALMEELRESGRDWQVKAQGLTERLAEVSVWRGLVRFPREPKENTVVANSGLANSMKPLLDSSYFGQITTDNQVAILEAYWEGIRRSIPVAFVEPSDFVIQKSLGATTMHLVLPTVLEVIRSRNGSVLDGDEYREVLEESLTELEEFTPSGNRVAGAGFWRSGSEGAAGSFSSNAGRRVLVARIKQRLPAISVL